MHKTTLEQWSLLDKVMKEGSFAKAADLTNRSQSSVSYNLAMLQQRIGITLLHIEGAKRYLRPPVNCCWRRCDRFLRRFIRWRRMRAPYAAASEPNWIWWWTASFRAAACSLS